jgi:hypothetical protein
MVRKYNIGRTDKNLLLLYKSIGQAKGRVKQKKGRIKDWIRDLKRVRPMN